MVLEIATLTVRAGMQDAFEAAFAIAQVFIAGAEGYITHELQRSIEDDARYVLLVEWDSVEHHTRGFRQSRAYQEWRALLHPFYDPAPQVEHFRLVAGRGIAPRAAADDRHYAD